MASKHDDTTTDEEEPTKETAADPHAQSANSGGYDRAPQDFESEVDPKPMRVPDHPVFVYPKVEGEIKKCSAHLVTQGDLEDQAQSNSGGGGARARSAPEEDAEDVGTEAMLELLNEKYVSPEFSLTLEDYRDAPAGYYDEYFAQIIPEMGN